MGCGASTSNPPLSATKMRLISEMPEDKRRACEQVFSSLDKDGNGSITLEDSIWAKPFLDAHDIDGDGRVTLVRSIPPALLSCHASLLSYGRTPNAQTARFCRAWRASRRSHHHAYSPLHLRAANRRTSTSTPAVGGFATTRTGIRRSPRLSSGEAPWARRANTSSLA
jgi:hypothetical protein|eukprot:COSAG02_NODE_84_length_39615_cov_144.775256_21_plen_168_part_00